MQFLVNYCQESSGNFISGTHKIGLKSSRPSAVQFCHGSPGATLCLLEAAKFFPDFKQAFYNSAIKGANHIWDYGICRKGFGLCHGISGNAYSFLACWNQENDKKKRERLLKQAEAFICTKMNESVMTQIRSWDWEGRDIKGVADEPFSLMCGLAGDLCYEFDLIFPKSSEFPGYEI